MAVHESTFEENYDNPINNIDDDNNNDEDLIRLALQFQKQQTLSLRDYLVIFMYGLIVLVSLFGNILVFKVIMAKRAMQRRTINIFIANLTISDLLMTIFTIPMNTARQILDNWPFGEICCKLVPFVQAISVYVSALSMTMIAVDRYQALVKPLRRRFTQQMPKWFWIMLIWAIASILSIPSAIFNHVVDVLAILKPIHGLQALYRCKVIYPAEYYRPLFTSFIFITEFCIPMSIVAYCYIIIGIKISKRTCIGETTIAQAQTHLQAKRKTIKMLIFVVATFAICWLPYNILFILEDFFQMNFSLTTHYSAHWLAMSSICYNPFIYFWLNHSYRQGILNMLNCFCCPATLLRNLSTMDNANNNEAISDMETIRTYSQQQKNYRSNNTAANYHTPNSQQKTIEIQQNFPGDLHTSKDCFYLTYLINQVKK